MKYFLYVVLLPVVLIVIFLFARGAFSGQKPPLESKQPTEPSVGAVLLQWETKTDVTPPVTVTVTPITLSERAETWRFDVVFDTHSGSLDEEVLTAVTLGDDKGNTYAPTAWEGSAPGGHHREGVLIFDAITPLPSYVELKIKNVGGVPERSLTWRLE